MSGLKGREKGTNRQLRRIEDALVPLTRVVGRLQVRFQRLVNGEKIDDDLDDETAIRNPAGLSKALKKAARKKKYRRILVRIRSSNS
jgi:hypothetical protein